MSATTQRIGRLVQFVGAMKRGEYPNAKSLARALDRHAGGRLAACSRTLQRDIEYLQLKLDAPIAYDPSHRGYTLVDPDWVFPLEELQGDLLYASLLGEQLSLPVMPPPFRSSLEDALKAQLAAADPEDVDGDLLRAVVFATGATAILDPAVFEKTHDAWRDARRLDILYAPETSTDPIARKVDIHALFLAQGAWYARAYCHLRGDWRSLALHRIREAWPLAERFQRDPAAIEQIRRGNIFDYETVRDAVVLCDPAKAGLLAEREWFLGQRAEWLPDGTLRLIFPEAPRRELLWWVLSYAGMIELVQPQDLREEILQAARRLVEKHGESRTPGSGP
jgi:predicted DNA-binding transcriptional regulator YafY